MPSETFHTRLEGLLKARGISKTAAAIFMGVSRYTVIRWCKYQMPDDKQITTLAAYLNVTVPHLTDGEPIDAKRAARCQYLHTLTTGLEDRHIEAMISLAEGLLATKLLQK